MNEMNLKITMRSAYKQIEMKVGNVNDHGVCTYQRSNQTDFGICHNEEQCNDKHPSPCVFVFYSSLSITLSVRVSV